MDEWYFPPLQWISSARFHQVFTDRFKINVPDISQVAGPQNKLGPQGKIYIPLCITGACCTVLNNCLYMFGGLLTRSQSADTFHELNLTTLVWNLRELPAKNPEY